MDFRIREGICEVIGECCSRKDGLGLVEVSGRMVYNQEFVWNWVK